MARTTKILIGFSLLMLIATLLFGVISSAAFLYPGWFNENLPFYQLRPMHVSAALFWIITGAVAGLVHYRPGVFRTNDTKALDVFTYTWVATTLAVFVFYGLKKFGGREYWEFPPVLCVPILVAWLALLYNWFSGWKRLKSPPLYVWMWTTGLCFFLFTFLEQNLYQIPWFRVSFLREVTVQWKSNGAMVGAWNQMINGTALFVMVKLSRDRQIARGWKPFFFYFLGLTNLMFNWGHHIYNLPSASWIRHVSYAISMTEWILFISIVRGFRQQLNTQQKYRHLLSYRFLIYAEYWVFANLTLALMMSIPAINRYTHGTHITVAHAMGTTIGINTMILLSSLGYMLRVDTVSEKTRISVVRWLGVFQAAFVVFWLSLIAAGIWKGYQEVVVGNINFRQVMVPIHQILHVFALAGVVMLVSGCAIVLQYLRALSGMRKQPLVIVAPSVVRPVQKSTVHIKNKVS